MSRPTQWEAQVGEGTRATGSGTRKTLIRKPRDQEPPDESGPNGVVMAADLPGTARYHATEGRKLIAEGRNDEELAIEAIV